MSRLTRARRAVADRQRAAARSSRRRRAARGRRARARPGGGPARAAARRRAAGRAAARRARWPAARAATRTRGRASTRRRASAGGAARARALRAARARARAAPTGRRARSGRARGAGARQAVAAAHPQHRRELDQPADVDEVVHPPQPDPLARAAPQRRRPGRAAPVIRLAFACPSVGCAVLDVVVERAVDEADVAARERRERDPVVVEVRELRRRERQRVVEQRAREQRRGARDRVGHQQRQQVRVVVARACPVRVRDQRAVLGDDPLVAVDELRVADRATSVSSLSGCQTSSWSAIAT